MMRKIIFLFLAFLCLDAYAQTTMRDMLKTMPDSLVPYLSENNRLDMIDFVDTNMEAIVTNTLGGKSQMNKLTDNYVSIRLNESSDLAMRLLDVETPVDSARQIVCVVTTYGTDIRESTIRFFSLSWKPLPMTDYLLLPDEMVVATIGDDDPTLTLQYECRLNAPANEEQKAITKPSTILKWTGKYVKGD